MRGRINMKIAFISLGCSKNLVDSEQMISMLESGGHVIVPQPNMAEAIVVNTCGFINAAKEEAIATILRMAEFKKKACKKLIVVGCLAQRYKTQLENDIEEIDAVISIHEYPELHIILGKLLDGNEMNTFSGIRRTLTNRPWSAYIKIAEGCSNRCSYCAIPSIRGNNVSKSIEDLYKEACFLANSGVRELVLIAQDTTMYGVDKYGKRTLLKLLQKLHEIKDIHWFRILYMYPDEIDDELIIGMSKLDRVLPYFDIPMQHANEEMLVLMNRRGSKQEVSELVGKIRKRFKDPTLRTTYIVGFPEETMSRFEELIAFVKKIQWNCMGAFTYSIEEDTPAYKMVQTVNEETKETRLDQLMQVQKNISFCLQQRYIGSIIEVLVEDVDVLKNEYRGRSKANAPDDVDGKVIFSSKREIAMGSFVQVQIESAGAYDLWGREIS